MDRRRFIKICGVTTALAGLQAGYSGLLSAAELKEYNRVKLVDGKGQPIKAKNLITKDAYIFQLSLQGHALLPDQPADQAGRRRQTAGENGEYTWEGGVGPNGTVVALTAICAHQLSYPEKGHTPISYYATEKSEDAGESGVIVCCEHDRVYDPAQGGKMTATNKKATRPWLRSGWNTIRPPTSFTQKASMAQIALTTFSRPTKRNCSRNTGRGSPSRTSRIRP